jgi:hypothetical protein
VRDTLERLAKQAGRDDAAWDELYENVDQLFASLRKAVDQSIPDRIHANTPSAEDSILSRLNEMLKDRVLAKPVDAEWDALIGEGKQRVIDQRPPGYMDAAKTEHVEGPAGDFLVYWQACKAAAERGLDLIIITGDEKEDWWWRQGSTMIGPRTEMVKEFFDLSGGRRLFLLRPPELLSRSEVLDVEVSLTSIEDADRAHTGESWSPEAWTREAVLELLARLDSEGQVQADVIREAAGLGGAISREAVYNLCGYDETRMLRGFTRPVNRITTDLQHEGILASTVLPMLTSLYPDDVRTSGFQIPPEVVTILGTARADPTDDLPGARTSKYQPLTEWLLQQSSDSFLATFDEIERILDFELAPSARRYPQYWHSVQNSMGKAISSGGYRANGVSVDKGQLRLTRK